MLAECDPARSIQWPLTSANNSKQCICVITCLTLYQPLFVLLVLGLLCKASSSVMLSQCRRMKFTIICSEMSWPTSRYNPDVSLETVTKIMKILPFLCRHSNPEPREQQPAAAMWVHSNGREFRVTKLDSSTRISTLETLSHECACV